jgi:hypothetical protein
MIHWQNIDRYAITACRGAQVECLGFPKAPVENIRNVRKETDSTGVVEVPAGNSAATRRNVSLEVKHCDSWLDGHGSAACCV